MSRTQRLLYLCTIGRQVTVTKLGVPDQTSGVLQKHNSCRMDQLYLQCHTQWAWAEYKVAIHCNLDCSGMPIDCVFNWKCTYYGNLIGACDWEWAIWLVHVTKVSNLISVRVCDFRQTIWLVHVTKGVQLNRYMHIVSICFAASHSLHPLKPLTSSTYVTICTMLKFL